VKYCNRVFFNPKAVWLLVDVFILRLQGCKQQLHPAAFARCGRSLAGREGLGNYEDTWHDAMPRQAARTLMTMTDTDSCQVHVRPEQVERIALDLGCLASSK